MSAVPVALPVMFTVSMASGSKELAKRGVLVTRLSAGGCRHDGRAVCGQNRHYQMNNWPSPA